jgi:hypothetical protein
VATFHLNPVTFSPNYEEDLPKREILITVNNPHLGRANELLGYIRFRWGANGRGLLEIVNFQAKLKTRHINFGHSTKTDDRRQAGQHGEGLKIGTLVLARNDYKVRFESTSLSWNWTIAKGTQQLVCFLSKPSKTIARKKKAVKVNEPRSAQSRIWEDVAIFIGKPPGKVSFAASGAQWSKILGGNTEGVHLIEFKKWLKQTIDIHPPKGTISTSSGEIITDPSYAGQLYLKGLLLKNGSASGKPYRLAYNFFDGSTNRDRRAIENSAEEAASISQIWRDAIKATPATASEYLNLLIDGHATLADTHNAVTTTTLEVATVLRDALVARYSTVKGKAFFCSKSQGAEVHPPFSLSFEQGPKANVTITGDEND